MWGKAATAARTHVPTKMKAVILAERIMYGRSILRVCFIYFQNKSIKPIAIWNNGQQQQQKTFSFSNIHAYIHASVSVFVAPYAFAVIAHYMRMWMFVYMYSEFDDECWGHVWFSLALPLVCSCCYWHLLYVWGVVGVFFICIYTLNAFHFVAIFLAIVATFYIVNHRKRNTFTNVSVQCIRTCRCNTTLMLAIHLYVYLFGCFLCALL